MINIYGHVSLGYGYEECDKKFMICTKEKWEGMSEDQQDEMLNEAMWKNIETWTTEGEE